MDINLKKPWHSIRLPNILIVKIYWNCNTPCEQYDEPSENRRCARKGPSSKDYHMKWLPEIQKGVRPNRRDSFFCARYQGGTTCQTSPNPSTVKPPLPKVDGFFLLNRRPRSLDPLSGSGANVFGLERYHLSGPIGSSSWTDRTLRGF